MYKQTTCSFSFGKVITSIYTDCDYLNNKLCFVAIFHFFSQFKYLSNELEQFYASSSSSSEKISSFTSFIIAVVPSHSFFPRLLGSSSSSRKFSDSDIHGKPRSAEENPLEITKFPSQDLAKPSSTTFDLEVLAQKEETPPAIRNKPDWLKDTEKPTSAKSTDDKVIILSLSTTASKF